MCYLAQLIKHVIAYVNGYLQDTFWSYLAFSVPRNAGITAHQGTAFYMKIARWIFSVISEPFTFRFWLTSFQTLLTTFSCVHSKWVFHTLTNHPAFQLRHWTIFFTTQTIFAWVGINFEAVLVELTVAGTLKVGEPCARRWSLAGFSAFILAVHNRSN